MAMVMIKCPKTGETVPTGVEIDTEMYESPATSVTSQILDECPACGETHTWSDGDSFVER